MHPSSTWLWRSALVEERPDASKEEQAFFSLHLSAMRERAKVPVSRIASDMPGYTVHDITHLDALWDMASPSLPRTRFQPAGKLSCLAERCFFYDAAMTLAAYPGGLADLEEDDRLG